MQKQRFKKMISLALSLAMVMAFLPFTFETAKAEAENPYGKWQTISGVTTIRCTWYAWEQAYKCTGVALPNFGNGGSWYNAAQKAGYATGTVAKPKSLAVWSDGSYGHVAYVVSVNGSTMKVNEGGMRDLSGYAYNGDGIINGSTCYTKVGGVKSEYSNKTLVGFIYLTEAGNVPSVYIERYTLNDSISDTNAILWGQVNKLVGQAVTKIGISVRKDGMTYEQGWSKTEKPTQDYKSKSVMRPFYNLNDELNLNLTHSTKYYYKFYAVVDGNEYWSEEGSFTTTGSHSYSQKKSEKAHPHKEYEVCSCGATRYTGKNIWQSVTDKAVAPTCTQTGLTEGKHCSVCNTVTQKQSTVSAKGHTEVIDKGIAPTCQKTGLSAGKHCSVCNTVIQKQSVVPVSGHNFGEWAVITSATTENEGEKIRVCSVCQTVDKQSIAKLSENGKTQNNSNTENKTDNSAKGKLTIKANEKLAIRANKTIVISANLDYDTLKTLVSGDGTIGYETKSEKDLLFTGSTITLKDEKGGELDKVTIIVMGDVDGDGQTSASDARLALRQSVGLENKDGVYLEAMKVGEKKDISAEGARLILRASVGLETLQSLLKK